MATTREINVKLTGDTKAIRRATGELDVWVRPAHLANDVEILHVPCSTKTLPDLLDGIDVTHVQAVAQDDGTHELIFTA